MKYYVKNGPKITVILNERFKVFEDKIVGHRGTKLEEYNLADFTEINVTTAKKHLAGCRENYNITNNIPSLMTAAQYAARQAIRDKSRAVQESKDKAGAEKLSIADKVTILEEAKRDIEQFNLTEIKVTDGEVVKLFTKAEVNTKLRALYKKIYDAKLVMIEEIENLG